MFNQEEGYSLYHRTVNNLIARLSLFLTTVHRSKRQHWTLGNPSPNALEQDYFLTLSSSQTSDVRFPTI
jgi:hypothetical protein